MSNEKIKQPNPRKLEGIVVSHKMQKTAVVEIERWRTYAKYQNLYKVSSRLKAHDEQNEYKEGDKVVIQETRPLSREKRWRIISKITNN